MKKIFNLLLFLFAVLTVNAQTDVSSAEVFVQVTQNGRYTVSIDDQFAGSAQNRFRFFDVTPGNVLLTISSNGKQLFSDNITVAGGKRTILNYSKGKGLQYLAQPYIYNDGLYALDNWNGFLVNENEAAGRPRSSFPGQRFPEGMGQQQFGRLLQSVKAESFDDGKYKVFILGTKNTDLTTQQTASILKLFTFDEKRIQAAIYAYAHVVDVDNFYQVRDLFTFSSSRDKIDKFLLSR